MKFKDRHLFGTDQVDHDLLDRAQHRLPLHAGVQLVGGHVEIGEVAAVDLDLVVLRGVRFVLVFDVVEAGPKPIQLLGGHVAVMTRFLQLHERFHAPGFEGLRGPAQLFLLLQDDACFDDLQLQPAFVALERRGHGPELFVLAKQALRVLLQFFLNDGDVGAVLLLGAHWHAPSSRKLRTLASSSMELIGLVT